MIMALISIALLISVLFMFLTSNLAYTPHNTLDKITPFECGFNPLYKNRIPFSLQFFLIALIFIVFDIEIVIMIPIPISNFLSMTTVKSVITLMTLLMLGLLHEWNQGALNWA